MDKDLLFEGAIVRIVGQKEPIRLIKSDLSAIREGRMSVEPVLVTEEFLQKNDLANSPLCKNFRYVHEIQLLFKLLHINHVFVVESQKSKVESCSSRNY